MRNQYWRVQFMPEPYRAEWITRDGKWNSETGAAIQAAAFMKDEAKEGRYPAVRLKLVIVDE